MGLRIKITFLIKRCCSFRFRWFL